ncbi:hypothetical protein RC94_02210 [Pectobacterium brasiliense]|uniref:hypothetical protein n=1 Tax=Pectobacterium brasiliense TaxID=180957 RepID=UPI000582A5E2|nr:hypothetical protein [Pectobacterium brasiliense]KHT13042.1 hypothetical protein RC94_02210 [Pectobacterium brasiliense]
MKSFDHYSIVFALNHLIDAVDAANQTNFFKDYFMPVFVVILSAITAYIIAIRGYQYQEASKTERMKADLINTVILQMQIMQSNLIAVKKNYCEDLTTHPIQRALNVPIMPIKIETVNLKPHELAQLLYVRKIDFEKYPWMNISSFIATYANFNMFVELLTIRNELDEKVKGNLAPLLSRADINGEIKTKDVRDLLSEDLLMKYVDLTEKFITLVDDLLITINDFLKNFPSKAAELIKKKYLKNYVLLQSYISQSEVFNQILVRCKDVDIDILAEIMKFNKEQATKMYIDNSIVIITPKD